MPTRFAPIVITATVCAIWLLVGERSSAQAQATGTIRGVVKAASPAPGGTLKVTTDLKTCGSEVPDESLLTAQDGGLANAVVVVSGLKAAAPPGVAVVSNKNCRFTPHVGVASPGGRLRITSEDNTLHTTHAYVDTRTLFNVAIPMPGIAVNRTLEGAGVVRLACDSHPWMQGYVYVTDYVAVTTTSDGTFEITDARPGTYELRVWHEKLPAAAQKVTVSAGQPAEVAFVLGKS